MTVENSKKEQEKIAKEVESNVSLVFYPPVYIQRYFAVTNILSQEKWQRLITKVVDYGCAELKLFRYIKHLEHVKHYCAVDIDQTLMNKCSFEARPMTYEYISGLSRKLIVDLFVGSIAEPDSRLFDADAVLCIELIEHVYQDTLEKVPSTVFEYLQPKLAIFTTPNAEFNVLFGLKGFRHYDHKFEWTRKEFENWCHSIVNMYNDYEVYFEGIGKGPEGTEHLGCVSQMAVFVRKSSSIVKKHKINVTHEPYQLYERLEYPYWQDTRSKEEKFINELQYRINNIMTQKMYAHFQRWDGKYEIPIYYLWTYVQDWCHTENILRDKLLEKGYTLGKSDTDETVVIIDEVENSDYENACDNDSDTNEKNDCNLISAGEEESWI